MFGLSGTAGHGRSGTASSVHREPELRANPRNCSVRAPLNYANKESFGFLLTPPGLCTGGVQEPPAAPPSPPDDHGPLTHVSLLWRRGEEEDWLRFGKPVAARIVDRRRRVESYAPRQVFALVRWASNDFGTVLSALDIVRAVGHGEAYTTLPQVDPGGELLLSVHGWPRVRRVFALIDTIEQSGIDPCEVAPDHWRHIHNRLAAGFEPRRYDPARHKAWLHRRTLWP